MAVSLATLAHSLGGLAEIDVSSDSAGGLRQAVEAARVLLDADTAGLLLIDEHGALQWAITADARAQTAALAQEHLQQGPCVAAFEHGQPVVVHDVAADDRWVPVLHQMQAAGLNASLSVPVSLDDGVVGVLDVYASAPRSWDHSQVVAAQTYAGVLSLLLGATLVAASAGELADQLQHALTARVQIEQAKGVLMAREGIGERVAWERLREQARSTQRPVREVVGELLAGFPDGHT